MLLRHGVVRVGVMGRRSFSGAYKRKREYGIDQCPCSSYPARSIPMMVGSCAAMAALVGTFDAAGKSITGSYSHATPIFGAPAAQHGSAVEGEGAEHAGVGERGWREERERRRQSFFKVSVLVSLTVLGSGIRKWLKDGPRFVDRYASIFHVSLRSADALPLPRPPLALLHSSSRRSHPTMSRQSRRLSYRYRNASLCVTPPRTCSCLCNPIAMKTESYSSSSTDH